jgi:ribose transport system substrate-binding protein
MRRRLFISVLTVCLCIATYVVATTTASAGGSSSAAGGFGVGLKLGKVLHTIPVGASVGPWLVWNKSTCSYQSAATHPKAYRAAVRKVVGGPKKIGYLHYGDTDPFGVANSKSIKAMATLAGWTIDRFNLKYPSETEPLVQARNAITKKEPAVLEGQQIDTLNPAFFKILEKQGCIPPVQLYLPVKNVPSFGAVWADTGTKQGAWLAQQAKARGWKPADTALVSCTDPTVGAAVNIMFDTAEKALRAGGFAISKSNVFRLVCKYSATESAQVRLTDWLTGHPTFKHLLINTIDDERTQGEINALKQAGRSGDALTIASGADQLGQQQIRSGKESASVAFFPEKYGEWLIPILEDVMAGNPVPSFTGSQLVVVTRANIGKYYKG